MILPILAVVLLPLVWGCGTPRSPAGPTTVTRDSSGISLVTSTAPRFPTPMFRVDSIPVLDLGGSGDPADEFSGAVTAQKLADGRIVVANQGTSEIRFFDLEGRRLLSVGRKGSGPGEFERIASLAVAAGDTVLVFDRATRRLTVLAPTGAMVRSGLIDLGRGIVANALLGVLPGGRILVSPARSGMPTTSMSGLVRDSADLVVIGADGRPAVVGQFPGAEAVLEVVTQGGNVTCTGPRAAWFAGSAAPTPRKTSDPRRSRRPPRLGGAA